MSIGVGRITALGGSSSSGGGGAAFTTIQTPSGTSPVATGPTDTLTLASSDLTITGNATTDTVTFALGASAQMGFWKTLGNTGTAVTTNFLGTIDNQAFAIRTQNIEAMRILGTSQYVGIGLTAPLAKLHMANPGSSLTIRLEAGASFGAGYEIYRGSTALATVGVGVSTAALNISTRTFADINFAIGSSNRVTIGASFTNLFVQSVSPIGTTLTTNEVLVLNNNNGNPGIAFTATNGSTLIGGIKAITSNLDMFFYVNQNAPTGFVFAKDYSTNVSNYIQQIGVSGVCIFRQGQPPRSSLDISGTANITSIEPFSVVYTDHANSTQPTGRLAGVQTEICRTLFGAVGFKNAGPTATIDTIGFTLTATAPFGATTGISYVSSSSNGYSQGSGNQVYDIYTYSQSGSTDVYSPTAVSVTFIESSFDLSPTNGNATINYSSSGGYAPSTTPIGYTIYDVQNTSGYEVSSGTASAYVSPDGLDNFDVNITWDTPGPTTNGGLFMIVRDGIDYLISSYNSSATSHSYNDTNSGWVSGSIPSSQYKFNVVLLAYMPSTPISGFRTLNMTAGTYQDNVTAWINNNTVSQSIVDDSMWPSGNTVTPNELSIPSFISQNDTYICKQSTTQNLSFFGVNAVPQQISSGSVTASSLYSTTEQNMLQQAYDALRAYGLMS